MAPGPVQLVFGVAARVVCCSWGEEEGGGGGRKGRGASLCKHGAVMAVFSLSLSLSTFLFLPLVTIIPLAVDVAQYPRGSDLRTPSRIR